MTTTNEPCPVGGKAVRLTPGQVHAVAEFLRTRGRLGLRDETIFRLGVETTQRATELLSLRVRDVWVDAPAYRGPLAEITVDKHRTKSKRSHVVCLSEDGQRLITRYMLWRGPVLGGLPLFPSNTNPQRALSYRQYQKYLRQAADYLGIPYLRSHSMRRTGANLALDAGASMEEIRELMDHSTVAVTSRYLESRPERMREVAERRAALLRAAHVVTGQPLILSDESR